MDSYGEFAFVYDKLINQDYEKIADRVEEIFKMCKIKPNLVLDLACGTGSLTVELAKRGYDMIGIDMSEEMLSVAYDKAADFPEIRFLCQDMTQFELYGTVDAIVCTLDAINYITDKRDVKRLFKLVNNYLNPNGLFVFDVNTVHKLENVLGNNTFVVDQDDVFYTWENCFDKKNNTSQQYLTFFEKTEEGYKRFDEYHFQRGYTDAEIKGYLKEANLEVLFRLPWEKGGKLTKNSEKVIWVSKKSY